MPPVSSNSELTSVHSPSKKLNVLRVFNVLTILLTFFSTSYSIVFPRPNIGEISNNNPTYFTPSLIFVGIFWFILYILQFGFAFYAQFSNIHIVQDVVEKGVGWWFSLSNLLTCGWLFFWMRESFKISEIFVLLILISTSIAHNWLMTKYTPNHLPTSVANKIVKSTHIPFAMFSAFSWLSLFHNGLVAFAPGYENDVYANIAVSFAWFLTIVGICWCITGLFSNGKRDGVFGFTIAWGLLGVAIQQKKTKYLSVTCNILALAEFIIIFIVWKRYGGNSLEILRTGIGSRPTRSRITSTHDDLREPLLPQHQEISD
ncbi:hypothetical protein RclHR1_00360046 [Rhizophagus clarus]|uniref:Tryptophan-rich sensory protein n=1 Tax=Rhizophagus clarus TaxID=94130 RepID=A0A2Z6RB87_9GLOM|nr:hypothetical protein RclHR1_00360046 [Rhizophagus clarus]GES84324.1 tryptophan-rich sensory protein [Rhizophagus clarus]